MGLRGQLLWTTFLVGTSVLMGILFLCSLKPTEDTEIPSQESTPSVSPVPYDPYATPDNYVEKHNYFR